jgi:hypothetical protein
MPAWNGARHKNRTSPRRCWGDVRAARVIGLPSVHKAPRCSVSASAHQDHVLTQTRGAEPHRGVLSVGARCCSCWERQPGGRTFSADTALACQRSLEEPYSALRPATRSAGDRPTSRVGFEPKTQLGTPRPAFRSPGVATASLVKPRRFRASASTSAQGGFGHGAGDRGTDAISVYDRHHSILDPGAESTRPDLRLVFPPSPITDGVLVVAGGHRSRHPAAGMPAPVVAVADRLGVVSRIALNANVPGTPGPHES